MSLTATQQKNSLKDSSIALQRFNAPLPERLARQIESFLLGVFEYGDYSFRSALRGRMAPLCCTAMVVLHHQRLIGVALSLTPYRQQGIALLGPVAVDQEFRRRGIATLLINRLCDYLARQDVFSTYLAARHNHPARPLYHQLGFQNAKGIVMRRRLNQITSFDENYFSFSSSATIRKADWSDYCGVQLLLIAPATMTCFDYQRGLFSSRTSEPTRFLSVFPDLMKQQSQNGGLTHVLVIGTQEKVMGLAHISRSSAAPFRHRATLDFFVHDPFIRYGPELVSQTIAQARPLDVQQICCYVPQDDQLKRHILEQLGATLQATLPRQLLINGQWQDTLIYCC